MTERAPILLHGATGFTGTLVAALLAERGLRWAASGRSAAKLEALRRSIEVEERGAPPVELVTVDVARPETLRAAIEGRAIVLACAGPFVEVGEPVLATCAELGVHYVDTTGEQRFVADAVRRHHATCERTGACAVPGMAFEIAPADWVSHLAAEAVGGAPDSIEILYANRMAQTAGRSGYAGATTRGTKKSMIRMMAEREPLQFVDGELRIERTGEKISSFALPSGRRLTAASFPSPEAVVVPGHTGARNVRTFMAVGDTAARAIHRFRGLAPGFVRAIRPLADRWVDRSPEGPEGDARGATFTILAEATRGSERARVAVTGKDPYGLTAAIQVHAAERAVAGAITARGVVGPSVGFVPREAMAALAYTGLALTDPA